MAAIQCLEVEEGNGSRKVHRAKNSAWLCYIAVVILLVGCLGLGPLVYKLLDGVVSFPNSAGRVGECNDLKNHGSYVSLRIGVGTPAQMFDVVADTGSNQVIIPDCACAETGGACMKDEPCFRGTKRSSSFSILEDAEGKGRLISMTFGSGTIRAMLATDIVSAGSLRAKMAGGILLIVDRRNLKIAGAFGGILGLGLPRDHGRMSQERNALPEFLGTAGVNRFSICVGKSGGAIRTDVAAVSGALGSVGIGLHWNLDFEGISINGASMPLEFCQTSPCGAIPDSGTTLIVGPSDQIAMLFEGICEQWPRCQSASAAEPQTSASELFKKLLQDCETWLSLPEGLDELPSLKLRLRGAGGAQQIVELSGWHYVFAVSTAGQEEFARSLFGGESFSYYSRSSDQKMLVCLPAFQSTKVPSDSGGAGWILGLPLFYAYTVTYDLSAQPPSMHFNRAPCVPCGEKTLPSFYQDLRQPRWIEGSLRVSPAVLGNASAWHIDMSRGNIPQVFA